MTSTETTTESGENPLVATSESPSGFTTGFGKDGASAIDNAPAQTAGSGLFNDVATTVKDFSDGDWANAAMDVATDGLDLLGAAMNPMDALASAGIGWLIEHISFLKEGLDKLAGNPEAVTAKAQTWQNISKSLNETADTYEQSAAKTAQSYKGEGGPAAYQKTAQGYADSLRGAAGHAQSASTAMQVAAAIVGTERGLIRDMISEFIGDLVVKGLAAAASALLTFGGTVAAFIADSVVEGGILAEKISTRIAKIVAKLEALAKNANKSRAAIEGAANALAKVGKTADKIVDKSLNAATKAESAANSLTQAYKDLKEATEAKRTAQEIREATEGEASPLDKSFLDLDKWTEEGHPAKPSYGDAVAVGTEARRQENEQADRSNEAAESYEEEHGEEESDGEGE